VLTASKNRNVDSSVEQCRSNSAILSVKRSATQLLSRSVVQCKIGNVTLSMKNSVTQFQGSSATQYRRLCVMVQGVVEVLEEVVEDLVEEVVMEDLVVGVVVMEEGKEELVGLQRVRGDQEEVG